MMKSGSQGAITPKHLDTNGMRTALNQQFNAKEIPPADKDKLLMWLNKKQYNNWYGAKNTHPSFGPHDDVKVFYNSILKASMEVGNSIHPVGSASVKEQHKGGNHYGWSVAIKTEKDSKGGDGWYWFETLDKTDKAKIAFEGMGEIACTSCHLRPGNKDLILSGFPLE